ncbi:MAG: single-stranded DNA-binding protein [Desulfobacteraceae bacterium]|nr:single-stranded DNA-binding protein [Desulfobacteraceae bacterium]
MNKLIEIQRELVVTKAQFNSFGNYSYRSSEDILLALKPHLVKHECVLTVSDKIHNLGEYIYIEAVATLKCDSESFIASSFARDGITQKGMNSAQVTNSASSFAKKQALSNLFLIDDTTEVAPSAEEQQIAKEENEKQQKLTEEQNKKVIDAFLTESEIAINKAENLTELKPIFGMVYRNAKKINQSVVDAVTEYYNNKKESIK